MPITNDITDDLLIFCHENFFVLSLKSDTYGKCKHFYKYRWKMAYDESTATLLFVTGYPNDYWLVSSYHKDSRLIEGNKFKALTPDELIVCSPIVLLSAANSDKWFIYNVNADHMLSFVGKAHGGTNFRSIACSNINNEIYAVKAYNFAVSLYHLVSTSDGTDRHILIPGSDFSPIEVRKLLFSGKHLLAVVRRGNSYFIELFCVQKSTESLQWKSTLSTLDAGLSVYFWNIEGDRLMVSTSSELQIYFFKKGNECESASGNSGVTFHMTSEMLGKLIVEKFKNIGRV